MKGWLALLNFFLNSQYFLKNVLDKNPISPNNPENKNSMVIVGLFGLNTLSTLATTRQLG